MYGSPHCKEIINNIKINRMYITGHYEFEILIKNIRGKNSLQRTVYRR